MPRLRQTVNAFARLALGLALIGWMLTRMDRGHLAEAAHTAALQWPLLLLAHALIFAALFACLTRWKLILDAQALPLSWWTVFRLFFVGLFFNTFMPGGTGGDLFKAYYTARETSQRKTEAVATVFIDRIIGLVSLALLVFGVAAIRFRFFWQFPLARWPYVIVLAGCFLGLGAVVFLFRTDLLSDPERLAGWRRSRMARVMDALARVYGAFYVCRCRPVLLAQTIALSLTIQFFLIGAGYCVARALGIALPLVDFATIIPIINIIGSIPVTPGGLGVREGVSVQMGRALGISQAPALLLAFLPYLSFLLWGLLGAVFFFLLPGKHAAQKAAFKSPEASIQLSA